MNAGAALRPSPRRVPYVERVEDIAMPAYRSSHPEREPSERGDGMSDPDRGYLWLALVVGAIPLIGALFCARWSDVELGVGTVFVALAGPALLRSYWKGS
jgi:hypothetical protein